MRIQLINPVEYAGKDSYKLDVADAQPGPLGVIFRSSALVNADGSFDVTLVPWQNIVSLSYAMDSTALDDESESEV